MFRFGPNHTLVLPLSGTNAKQNEALCNYFVIPSELCADSVTLYNDDDQVNMGIHKDGAYLSEHQTYENGYHCDKQAFARLLSSYSLAAHHQLFMFA